MKKEDELLHYGVKRRSGRYPWGSGDDPYQHDSYNLIATVDEYRRKGLSDTDIAKELGMSTTQLRSEITLADKQIKLAKIKQAHTMSEDCISNVAIAERLGVSEATVRNYLKTDVNENKHTQIDNIASALKSRVDESKYIDIGKGVEAQMGVSRQKLDAIATQLEKDGYFVHEVYVPRIPDGSGEVKYLTLQVLTKDPDKQNIIDNYQDIRTPEVWSDDGGMTVQNIYPPKQLDWDRVGIRYAEQGGKEMDGTIELRRGAEGIDLGNSNYAQVRIAVGGTHYLKGMAFYSENLPDGVDVMFNTNKAQDVPREEVLKKLKPNPDNPFGSTISRQIINVKEDGSKEVSSYLNIVNEEGTWYEWKHNMSSQFLSKQPLRLISDRLDATYDSIQSEHDDISKVENPVVQKYLYEQFARSCDSRASKLDAQGTTGGTASVILPVTNMKPTEIYAPNYENGEKVVLIRYPHGGTFELAELTVNNKQQTAKGMIGNAIDAVGIHPSVAEKLSGADFDGDTVYIFKNSTGPNKIKTSNSLKELQNFDPNMYAVDHPTITSRRKQTEMGIVSNLITDMTLQGASPQELARAVKHSMVVIDSEKHQLDWKQSAIDNGIAALHEKYQGSKRGGASTLISKADKDVYVDKDGNILKSKQVPTGRFNPKTGKEYKDTVYVNANGEVIKHPIRKSLISVTPDAHDISSGTPQETLYANYANKLKALKNTTEKEAMAIKDPKVDKKAAQEYAPEVASLNGKLARAISNAPRERQAQVQATYNYYKKKQPGMDKDELKKLRTQVTAGARSKTGAKTSDVQIHITDREWKAINSNAVSSTKLRQILRYSNSDEIKQRATPRTTTTMSSAKQARARSMLNSGHTWKEISDALGVPISTVASSMSEE